MKTKWAVMWYEQGDINESFKKGFATREKAEAWANKQPSVRHRYSHAVVYNAERSYGLRRVVKKPSENKKRKERIDRFLEQNEVRLKRAGILTES